MNVRPRPHHLAAVVPGLLLVALGLRPAAEAAAAAIAASERHTKFLPSGPVKPPGLFFRAGAI